MITGIYEARRVAWATVRIVAGEVVVVPDDNCAADILAMVGRRVVVVDDSTFVPVPESIAAKMPPAKRRRR